MPLPNLIIAGERRSGTTSIAHWMRSHPDVFLAPEDDMAYFVDRELVGRRTWMEGEVDLGRWSEEHSPEQYAGLFEAGAGKQVIGEKSADYLYCRAAHQRMSQYVPSARLLIVLRDPVRRAWSMYWNEVAKGRESLTFEQAVEGEQERCERSAYARHHLSYVRRGFYAQSLRHLFQHYPPEQVQVLILERCLADPLKALRQVYRFLGVDPERGLEHAGERLNENFALLPRPFARDSRLTILADLNGRLAEKVGRRLGRTKHARRRIQRILAFPFWQPAAKLEMSLETQQQLRSVYEPHVKELEELLGEAVPEWRR